MVCCDDSSCTVFCIRLVFDVGVKLLEVLLCLVALTSRA